MVYLVIMINIRPDSYGFVVGLQERERIRCVECIGHVLSVQDTSAAVKQVQAIFNPYVQGLARLVQHQVRWM